MSTGGNPSYQAAIDAANMAINIAISAVTSVQTLVDQAFVFNKDILPVTDDMYNLGNDSFRWLHVGTDTMTATGVINAEGGINISGPIVVNGVFQINTTSTDPNAILFNAVEGGLSIASDLGININTSGNMIVNSTDNLNITSQNAITVTMTNGFTVGCNGATNPVLNLNTPASNCDTGLQIRSYPKTTNYVNLLATGSQPNITMTLDSQGSGGIQLQTMSGTGQVLIGDGLQVVGSSSFTSTNNDQYAFIVTTDGGSAEKIDMQNLLGTSTDAFTIAARSGGISMIALSGINVACSNTNAFVIAQSGSINPAFNVDTSIANCTTGLNIKSNTINNGVNVSCISNGTNERLLLDSLGTAGMELQNNGGTGAVTVGHGLQVNGDTHIQSQSGLANAISLVTNGGVSETINIDNQLGTSATAINLNAQAGGITLLSAGGNINLNPSGSDNINIGNTSNIGTGKGSINLQSTLSTPSTSGASIVGTGTIQSGNNSVIVSNLSITGVSQIFLTYTSDPGTNGPIFVASQASGTFTAALANSGIAATNIGFNYFVIN